METTTKIAAGMSAGLLGAALVLGGCNPEIEGQEGNLTLTYDQGAMPEASGSTPLAVDTTLEYAAYPQEDEDEDVDEEERDYVTFTGATSDDDSVVQVDEVSDDTLRLAAVGEGSAIIDVDAEDADGEELVDSFEIETATVEGLRLDHPCTNDEEARYLVDHDVQLDYRMSTDDDNRAVGVGYYPVDVEPEEGGELGEGDTNGLLPLQLGEETGEVGVESTLDDAQLNLELIEEGDIDGVELSALGRFEEGESAETYLVPQVEEGGEQIPVCQHDADLQVESETEEVCEVSYAEADDHLPLRPLYEPNALHIEVLEEGECEFRVEMPGANGGDGVEETFSAEVDPDEHDE